MLIIYILSIILVLTYFSSIIVYIIGNLKKDYFHNNNFNPSISIIIAVKNGEKSLPKILNDLKKQFYNGLIEFIIVDDNSSDSSKKIIMEFEASDNRFKYISSNKGNSKLLYKKKALDAGIKNANYDILLFTDVDCRLKKTWVKSMAQKFDSETDYVIGVSIIDKTLNLVTWFQKIDLMMLFNVARGMCKLNIPFASIGQNQAYRKTLYEKVGFLKISDSIQGDDTLFLQLCMKEKIKVKFNDNPESFVQSRIESKILSLIKQRIRWAADLKVMWNYNKLLYFISLSTFYTNMLIILLLADILSFSLFNYYELLYFILIIKLLLEFLLYIIGNFKMKLNYNYFAFIFWFIFEIPYVLFMGIGSFFIQFIGWRGQNK